MPSETRKRNAHDRAGARTHRNMIKNVMGILCDLRTEGHEVPNETRKRNQKF